MSCLDVRRLVLYFPARARTRRAQRLRWSAITHMEVLRINEHRMSGNGIHTRAHLLVHSSELAVVIMRMSAIGWPVWCMHGVIPNQDRDISSLTAHKISERQRPLTNHCSIPCLSFSYHVWIWRYQEDFLVFTKVRRRRCFKGPVQIWNQGMKAAWIVRQIISFVFFSGFAVVSRAKQGCHTTSPCTYGQHKISHLFHPLNHPSRRKPNSRA